MKVNRDYVSGSASRTVARAKCGCACKLILCAAFVGIASALRFTYLWTASPGAKRFEYICFDLVIIHFKRAAVFLDFTLA